MQALEQRFSSMESNETVQFAALPAPIQENPSRDAIVIRLGEIEVEIPAGASRESIAAVIDEKISNRLRQLCPLDLFSHHKRIATGPCVNRKDFFLLRCGVYRLHFRGLAP